MIDTAKPYFYLTDMVLDRLEDQRALTRLGIKLYGNKFYLPHPFGYKNPAIFFNLDQRVFHFETSLPKLLHGHNVFGSNRLQYLCLEVVKHIYRCLGLQFTSNECQEILDHRIRLGRLDTTCSFLMPTRQAVAATAEEICHQLRADGRRWSADGIDEFQTTYNQKHSERVTDKFYDKFAQLLVHPIPDEVPQRDQIMKLAERVLRYEVTWRGKELARLGLNYADQWDRERVISVMAKRLDQLNFRGTISLLAVPNLDDVKLNQRDKAFYRLWQRGSDLRAGRHYSPIRKARQTLLDMHGVDIFRPLEAGSKIALKEILAIKNARFSKPPGLGRTVTRSVAA